MDNETSLIYRQNGFVYAKDNMLFGLRPYFSNEKLENEWYLGRGVKFTFNDSTVWHLLAEHGNKCELLVNKGGWTIHKSFDEIKEMSLFEIFSTLLFNDNFPNLPEIEKIMQNYEE